MEYIGGILLFVAFLLSMAIENSPLREGFDGCLATYFSINLMVTSVSKPLLLWINDGLMAIFFLFIGLEIKREILEGELSNSKQRILPVVAAIGGLIAPSLIYIYFNYQDKVALNGWAIPAATDIAFALGLVYILGKWFPPKLKVCLVALAILDDLAAIIIISVFYTQNLSLNSLLLAGIGLVVLYVLNRKKVYSLIPYLIVGFFLWVSVLKSGVHATLAGVLTAFFIPYKTGGGLQKSPALKLEKLLHPWISYAILPIFALANAGVLLEAFSYISLQNPVSLGIIAGLFIGKPVGVMFATYLGRAFNIASLPGGISWMQFLGMSFITGIGFTMSLFIGSLAFESLAFQNYLRVGVIVGSILSAVAGSLLIRLYHK